MQSFKVRGTDPATQDVEFAWNIYAEFTIETVRRTIRTMGLPVPKVEEGPRPCGRSSLGALPSPGQVRGTLLNDWQFQQAVQVESFDHYLTRCRLNGVNPKTERNLLWYITVRTTWRLATARARELLRTVQPRFGGAEPVTLQLDECESFDTNLDLQEDRTRLDQAMAQLKPWECQLLLLKAKGLSYGQVSVELAESFGVNKTPKVLKTHQCRLLDRLCRLMAAGGTERGLGQKSD
ncbi:MAG: hypothetical protein HY898_27965 [Deltaproteobacteria bacterium]|nr:hypothetical protein [Deltaproteobacteria bacterium]